MVGAKRAVAAVSAPVQGAELKPLYLEALTLVERLIVGYSTSSRTNSIAPVVRT
jgi:hypothetical protein